MIKLRFSKPKYTKDIEKKIIRCIFNCSIVETEDAYTYDSYTVVGTATCHPDDAFDEKKGARIANSKAKQQAYKVAKTFYNKEKIVRLAAKYIEEVSFCNYMKHLQQEEENHMKESLIV